MDVHVWATQHIVVNSSYLFPYWGILLLPQNIWIIIKILLYVIRIYQRSWPKDMETM